MQNECKQMLDKLNQQILQNRQPRHKPDARPKRKKGKRPDLIHAEESPIQGDPQQREHSLGEPARHRRAAQTSAKRVVSEYYQTGGLSPQTVNGP